MMLDDYSPGEIIGLGVVFMIVPLVGVSLRLWAKLLGRRGILFDDYLVVIAAAIAATNAILTLVAATLGNLGQNELVDEEGQPITSDPRLHVYAKMKFVQNVLNVVGLGFTKASILVLYAGIFTTRSFRRAVYTVVALVIAWTITFTLTNIFTCRPVSVFNLVVYGGDCIDSTPMWQGMAISDLLIDIIIFVLPIPRILKLQLPSKQKIGVLLIFLLGATVIAFSITRAVVYEHVGDVTLPAHPNNETYYVAPVFIWNTIELSSAVLCVSLPTYRPIWLFLTGQAVQPSKSVQFIKDSSYAEIGAESGRAREPKKGSTLSTMNLGDEIPLNEVEYVHTNIHSDAGKDRGRRNDSPSGMKILVHNSFSAETSSRI